MTNYLNTANGEGVSKYVDLKDTTVEELDCTKLEPETKGFFNFAVLMREQVYNRVHEMREGDNIIEDLHHEKHGKYRREATNRMVSRIYDLANCQDNTFLILASPHPLREVN